MITRHNHLESTAPLYFNHGLPAVEVGLCAALIGPEGGAVSVTDPRSLLFGTTLRIPPGALETLTLIQIEQGEHQCPFGLSPSVKITPEGLSFKRPAEIDMRVSSQSAITDDLQPSFYVYDGSSAEWVPRDGQAIDPQSGVFRCSIWQL